MFRFESLDIWKMAITYASKVYDFTDEFPQKVQYSLASQLRNSSLSISNNIAEGSGSSSKLEFKSFLNYSIRSLYETVSGLILAKEKNYLAQDKFDQVYQESELLVKKIRAFRSCL
ncbi:MAG: four helix bundle protein [Candidatus Omnitrophica bacterium]|nr:four helix bundle protein [Candidatus Omnitrophota bacterium]